MGRIRLALWLVLTGAAAWVLLLGPRWSGGDPASVAMTVVRLGSGVLAAHLFVATIAALARRPWLPAPAIVHRVVAGAIGGGMLLTPAGAAAEPREVPPPAEAPADAPVLRRIDPEVASPPEAAAATDAEPSPASSSPGPREVVAVAGDHLWALARRALAERLGREPSDAEVAPYWRAVVEANRDRLATDDPDLIFPGQTFVLP